MIKRFSKASWIFLVVLSVSAWADTLVVADWKPEPPFKSYSALNGLSQSAAVAIAQDKAGYLWVGTRRGLNRFDGTAFTHFTIANGLPENNVTALEPGDRGLIWVGDDRGNVSGLAGDQITVSVAPAAAKGSAISDIRAFGDDVWVATHGSGLFRFDPVSTQPELQLVTDGLGDLKDLTVYDNKLWFVAGGTLYRTAGEGAIPESVADDVLAISAQSERGLWIGQTGNRIGVYSESGIEPRYAPELSDAIVELAIAADGRVSAATAAELVSFKDRGMSAAPAEIETTRYAVTSTWALHVDRENTLWIGTENGLFRHLGDRFQHYRIPDGFGDSNTWAVGVDGDGKQYFSTNEKLLRRDTNGTLTDLSSALALPGAPVRDLIIEGGRIWLGIRGEGLYLYNTQRQTARPVPGTAGLEILDLELDQHGYLWLATFSDGVFSVNTNTFAVRQFKTPENKSVFTLDVDSDGNIWYGIDYAGIAKLERRGENAFGIRFFGGEFQLDNIEFDHIVASSPEEVWIGGENGQLIHLHNDKVRNFSAKSPLKDQTIYVLHILDEERVLLGGEQGLYYFNTRTGKSIRYGPLQGFLGLEVNVHATHVDPNGFLWIGTVGGPTRMNIQTQAPTITPISPELIRVASTPNLRPIAAGGELAWEDGGIQFDFEAVSLELPGRIEFSYRLEGHDTQWSTPSRNRSVNFSGLEPGAYRFQVRARYPGQDWQINSEGFKFSRAAPFWYHRLFQLTVSLVILGAIIAMVRWRTSRVHHLNERLRAEVEERTRSIEAGRIELMERNEQLHDEVEQRRKADAARAELEERFRVAFQSTPIGMALLDRDGLVLNSNRALRRMFLGESGQQSEELTLGADSRLFVSESDRQRFEDHLADIATAGEHSVEFEVTCRGHTGDELSAVVSMTAVHDDDQNFLYSIAQVQDVSESRRLTDKLEYQANYDELSGLLNRRSFEAALTKAYEQAGEGNGSSYLMFMDLDQFKIVNDTSGHSAGDELLRQVSQLIGDRIRGNDIVGRLGGDEFGLILWQCPITVAQRVAEAVRLAIEEFQFNWDAETHRVGISIGVVPIDPALGNLAEIQQLADAACYEAKDNGRNRVQFAKSESEGIVEQRGDARWVQRLHDAMENNRFALYGQIIKPISDNVEEPERMEILLRMRDLKTRKLIPPGAFLPAAERYGLSVKLDEWVVRSLLKMLFVHEAVGASDRRYWVNLSGNSVGDKRFVDFLIDAITNSGLPRGMINFEITETAVIRNVSEAGRLMEALHGMGCQFALDDFGSGLSSFGYLKKLPVDYLKIDGMFIRDITSDETDRIFVKSIIDIARSMQIKTIAEFVEDDEILAVLRELGADYAQGFGVHRPELIAPEFPSIHIPLARVSDQKGRLPEEFKEGTA